MDITMDVRISIENETSSVNFSRIRRRIHDASNPLELTVMFCSSVNSSSMRVRTVILPILRLPPVGKFRYLGMDQVPSLVNSNTSSRRYYCHTCRAEVNITNEFTCVECSGSFVEEVPENFENLPRLLRLLRRTQRTVPPSVPPNSRCSNRSNSNFDSLSETSIASTNSTTDTFDDSSYETVNDSDTNNSPQPAASGRGEHFPNIVMSMVADVIDLLGGTNDAPQTSRRSIFMDNFRVHARDVLSMRNSSSGERNTNNNSALDTLFDLVFRPPQGGVNTNINFGNQNFSINESLRHNIDFSNILMSTVNRLLPPLSRSSTNETLQRIPKVEVTAEDKVSQNRCSICWNDFELKESVRKLPCTHLFHEKCIFPWLRLHQTCPLCRSRLADDMGLGDINMDGPSVNDEIIELMEDSSEDT